jgi:hypothetical protein
MSIKPQSFWVSRQLQANIGELFAWRSPTDYYILSAAAGRARRFAVAF